VKSGGLGLRWNRVLEGMERNEIKGMNKVGDRKN
jgi:hypothetical protein